MTEQDSVRPACAPLRARDGIALVVGMVVGIGIFKAPSLVAAKLDDPLIILSLWALGGIIVLIGALCYAELASACPAAGGEYQYLFRAYGPATGFLFAWGRLAVVQTGAIAAVAFVIGDYAQRLWPLGPLGPALYAAMAVVATTTLNVCGTRLSARLQNILAAVLTLAVLVVALLGFVLPAAAAPAATQLNPETAATGQAFVSALGFAMIFVMLTYGGWNEAAYLTAELRNSHKTVVRVFVGGSIAVSVLYLLLNAAYLYVLDPATIRTSDAVGADYMQALLGPYGATALSLLVIVAALTTLNATLFTGARSACVMGRDMHLFSLLGQWDERAQGPVNAHVVQGALALLLIGVGAATRQGFSAMVEFTAPVFWLFLFLTGLSLFVFRRRGLPEGSFRVPLYPLTPILFCASSLLMLQASLLHTGAGALLGAGILCLGWPLWMFSRRPIAET